VAFAVSPSCCYVVLLSGRRALDGRGLGRLVVDRGSRVTLDQVVLESVGLGLRQEARSAAVLDGLSDERGAEPTFVRVWARARRQLGALPPGVAADMIAASKGARLLAIWVQPPAPLVYDCRSVWQVERTAVLQAF
jgi:hypothetical protein